MGSGASKAKEALEEGTDVSDTYPNGPLDDAPARLLVAFGNGEPAVFTKRPAAWNRKCMYADDGDLKLFYRACVGWVFDARAPAECEAAGDDWAVESKGWIGLIDGGPAFPPLGPEVKLHDGAAKFVSVVDLDGPPPPHALAVFCHPSERACGAYATVDDEATRSGFPKYRNDRGWTLAYDGGGWAFSSGVSADERDGGWVGPFCWSHPPLGETVRLNGLDEAFVFGEATVVIRTVGGPDDPPPPSPREAVDDARATPAAPKPASPKPAPAPPPKHDRPATPKSKATAQLDGFSDAIDAVDLSLSAKIVDELLTQIVCRIDGVDTCGDASLREYRKGLIKRIDAITASLTSKIQYDQPEKPPPATPTAAALSVDAPAVEGAAG